MSSVDKHKRVVLTLKQKNDICSRLEKGTSGKVLMNEYNIRPSTLYNIKAQRSKLKEFFLKSEVLKTVERHHKLHQAQSEDLNKVLYKCFLLKDQKEYVSQAA